MRVMIILLLVSCGANSTGSDGGAGGGAGGGVADQGLQPGQQCVGEYACRKGHPTELLACEETMASRAACAISGGSCSALQTYPCRGGCTFNADSNTTFCVFLGALRGDLCPRLQKGKGFCSDAGVMLCTDAGWVEKPCQTCREQNGQLFCN